MRPRQPVLPGMHHQARIRSSGTLRSWISFALPPPPSSPASRGDGTRPGLPDLWRAAATPRKRRRRTKRSGCGHRRPMPGAHRTPH